MGTGAISVHSIGLVESILPGSESRANAYWGSLGTWELPSISAPIAGWDLPADQVPGSWRGPLASTRAKPQSAQRYRHATATERVGWTREVLASS
jgi:hypothetical protein